MKRCTVLLIAFAVLLFTSFVAGCGGGSNGLPTASPEASPSGVVSNSPAPQQQTISSGTWEASIYSNADPSNGGEYTTNINECGTYSDGKITVINIDVYKKINDCYIYGETPNGIIFWGKGENASGLTMSGNIQSEIGEGGTFSFVLDENTYSGKAFIGNESVDLFLNRTEANYRPLKGGYGEGVFSGQINGKIQVIIGYDNSVIVFLTDLDNNTIAVGGSKLNSDGSFTVSNNMLTITSDAVDTSNPYNSDLISYSYNRKGTWQLRH